MAITRNPATDAINNTDLVTLQGAIAAGRLQGAVNTIYEVLEDIQKGGWARDEVVGQSKDIMDTTSNWDGPLGEPLSLVSSAVWLLLGDTYLGDVDASEDAEARGQYSEVSEASPYGWQRTIKIFLPQQVRPVLGQWLRECQLDGVQPYQDDFRIHLHELAETPALDEVEGIAMARDWANQLSTETFNLAVQQIMGELCPQHNHFDPAQPCEECARQNREASDLIDQYEAEVHSRLPPY